MASSDRDLLPHTFSTSEQALVEGAAQACALLAEQIAADNGLDENDVELAKAAALERFEAEST